MPEEKLAAAGQLQIWWILAIAVFLVLVPLAVSWTNKREERQKAEDAKKGPDASPEDPS